MSSPLEIIPIQSAIASASSMKCVTTITTLPTEFSFISSQNFHLAEGSKFVVGSSRTNIFGFPINATPRASFLLSPPESSEQILSLNLSKYVSLMI